MSLLQLNDPLIGGTLNATLGSLEVKRLTINGREITVLSDTQALQQTIQQIQQRISELDVFCKALSEAIFIGPADGEANPVSYPPAAPG